MNYLPPVNDHYNPMTDTLNTPNLNNSFGTGHFTNTSVNNSSNINPLKSVYNKSFNKNNNQTQNFNNNTNKFNNSNKLGRFRPDSNYINYLNFILIDFFFFRVGYNAGSLAEVHGKC